MTLFNAILRCLGLYQIGAKRGPPKDDLVSEPTKDHGRIFEFSRVVHTRLGGPVLE